MIKFNLSEDNQWLILAQCTEEVEKKQVELSLTKKIHNWYFHPLVKKKIWDGSINFIDKRGPFWKIPIGLWSEVLEIGKEYGYEFHIEGIEKLFLTDLKLEDFKAWVDEFFKDSGIEPREYQIEAAWKIVKFRYSVSEIATSSGKTLISFMIFAFLKSQGYIRKFLMIVPSTNLVIQGTEDFEDYGIDKIGSKIQQIGGGSKMREGCDVVIGTFQSLVKKDREYFEEFDAVFIDEAHHTNSTSI
jgi:CRISPR/Cas system-associated endonuclease/helicase Cas3